MQLPRIYQGEDGRSRLDSIEVDLFEDEAGDGHGIEAEGGDVLGLVLAVTDDSPHEA